MVLWVSRFIGAKDDGSCGDNCSYKTCKAPVKLSRADNNNNNNNRIYTAPYGRNFKVANVHLASLL